MQNPIRNIAIMAHADAGKTTITEQFLFLSGQTRQPGNVDQGTAQTDDLPVERERGISVRSSHTAFHWNNVRINLIDTPGHVDFSADVERIIRVADGVILVISAVEGVQSHTVTLWEALQKRNIPVILFVNKIDRTGADSEPVIRSIVDELDIRPVCLQKTKEEGGKNASVKSLWSPEYMDDQLIENIVSSDETLFTKYIGNQVLSFGELDLQLINLVRTCSAYVMLFGSAKLGLGMAELLDAVVRYLPSPTGDSSDPLSALVFGVSHDKIMGKIAHIRIYNGTIRNREVVYNDTRRMAEKITQVRRIFPGRYEEIGIAEAGDIAGISGFGAVQVGDLLGSDHQNIPGSITLQAPLITVKVTPDNLKDYQSLAEAMQELAAEDPALEYEWLREESEFNVKVMGPIQMEVLERILSDRFGLIARFENPTVIYKETPAGAGEGFVQYWMPKPCWAIMKFRIEPGKRGSGVVYHSIVPVNDVQQKYQKEAERSIAGALKQGIKGWEVTDLRITLIEGEDHPVHSRAGDFAVATPMGIMDGLVNTGTILLEPMLRFQIIASEDLLGVITSDITRMRGMFESAVTSEGRFVLKGLMPLATSLDYPVKLSSRSGGKARIFTRFDSYRECTDEQGVIRTYKGISPLDTAKYILKARKAIQ